MQKGDEKIHMKEEDVNLKPIIMKNLVIIIILLCFVGCNNQNKDKLQNKKIAKQETIIKPNGKWEVVKEYDEQGNLIRYDSVYSWYYSNKEGDSLKVNLDSIMDSFKRYFGENTPLKWNKDFSYFPKDDSLFMRGFFFQNDYFYKNWKNQHSELEDMIKKMDSSRYEFLKKFHPGLMESVENNTMEI